MLWVIVTYLTSSVTFVVGRLFIYIRVSSVGKPFAVDAAAVAAMAVYASSAIPEFGSTRPSTQSTRPSTQTRRKLRYFGALPQVVVPP